MERKLKEEPKEVEIPAKLAIYLTHKQAILLNAMYGFGAYSFLGHITPALIMYNTLRDILPKYSDEERQDMANMISAIAKLVPEDVKKEIGITGAITFT